MRQPKRYFLKISQTISGLRCETYEAENGEYVEYADYAALQAEVDKWQRSEYAVCKKLEEVCEEAIRLQAENERLKAETVKQIEAALPPIEAYIAKLEAENERLRAAGDALADKVRHDEKMLDEDWGVDGAEHRTVAAWLAAKGVQP